jgi:RND superfamily putative drug exporter
MNSERTRPPFIARTIRRFSLIIILAWLLLTVISTLISVGGKWSAAIPSLERVAEKHSVSLMPKDAPSVQAMMRIGQDFKESNSDSSAMWSMCRICGGIASPHRACKAPTPRLHMCN